MPLWPVRKYGPDCTNQTVNVFAVGEITYGFKEFPEFAVSGAKCHFHGVV
jgi:hypothetical protein